MIVRVSVLDMPADDLLAILEAAASEGNEGAEWVLRNLLEEEARTGELGVIARLSASPYLRGVRADG